MVNLDQFASVSGLALLILVIVQVLKAVLPLSDGAKAWLPAAAIGLGLVLAPLIGVALGRIDSPVVLVSWLLGGFLAGAEAVGVYEGTLDKVKKLPFFSEPVVSEPESWQ